LLPIDVGVEALEGKAEEYMTRMPLVFFSVQEFSSILSPFLSEIPVLAYQLIFETIKKRDSCLNSEKSATLF